MEIPLEAALIRIAGFAVAGAVYMTVCAMWFPSWIAPSTAPIGIWSERVFFFGCGFFEARSWAKEREKKLQRRGVN